ncbi:hypothetical protein PIB30_094605, partial [Stylosanthes scabra]|nr:hypothetical protein [Stylosanthes scabra]
WRVKAMPRLPGARLGVGLSMRSLLHLRRKGAMPKSTSRRGCMLARVAFYTYAWAFHAYAWLGDARGHPRPGQGCLGVVGSWLVCICVHIHAYAWGSSTELLPNFVYYSASFLSSFFL